MICIFPSREKAEIMDFMSGEFVQIGSSHPETHRETVSYPSSGWATCLLSEKTGVGILAPGVHFHLLISGNAFYKLFRENRIKENGLVLRGPIALGFRCFIDVTKNSTSENMPALNSGKAKCICWQNWLWDALIWKIFWNRDFLSGLFRCNRDRSETSSPTFWNKAEMLSSLIGLWSG